MKRTLFIFVAFLALAAAQATAQDNAVFETQVPTIEGDGSQTIGAVLADLAQRHQFALVMRGEVDLEQKFQGFIPAGTLLRQIGSLLKGVLNFEAADGTIILYGKGAAVPDINKPLPGLQSPASQQPGISPAIQTISMPLPYLDPNTAARAAIVGARSFDEANARIGAVAAAYRQPWGYGGVYNQPWGGSYGYQYGGGYGTYGYGGYGLYPWMKGCADGRPSAFLELQYRGKRGEKHLWLISINGVGPGTVDQADTFGQKLPVCSDAAVVVTVEKIGLPWKWERQYSLRPYVSTEVGVGEFLSEDSPRTRPK
jgi:hypothetical protein